MRPEILKSKMATRDSTLPETAQPIERLSCKTCRQRKVRCNRIQPCSNCVKAGFECTFPVGRRRPREGRHQLALRLHKLESHLQDLASSVNSQNAPAFSPAIPTSVPSEEPTAPHDRSTSASLSRDVGKLNVNADQSRYSSNVLWATLSREIAEMQDLLQSEEVIEVYDKDLSRSPSEMSSQGRTPDNPAWLFPTQKPSSTQRAITSDVLDKSILWTAYVENVAPLIKIFHTPTMKKLWQDASSGKTSLTAVEETAFDSIYFAAAVSLQDSETRQLLNRSKDHVIQTQGQSLEQSFHDAELLNSGSVTILQAFILYIITLRRLDDTRLVLSMIGIAARLAISLGLQRDGSKFNIDVFDAELRRRIWWQLSLLDFELSNDHGVDPMLQTDTSDTALPSNINDDDIRLGMTEPPFSRNGFTEMTSSLVRFKISVIARKLLYTAPSSRMMTLQRQRTTLESLQEQLRDEHLSYCSNGDALQWATTVVARSKVTMLWLSVYHQLQQVSAAPNQELDDKMMRIVIEIVDSIRIIESDSRTAQWGWYFHHDIQWPAIVYLLHQIIRRPPDYLSDRAWDVLKRARDQWYEKAGSKVRLQGMLFKPMRALTNRAFWVKEGKQPPSRIPMPNRLDSFNDFRFPDDFDFNPLEYVGAPEMPEFYTVPNFANTSTETTFAGLEADIVPEFMENFMLPLWNQGWQFLIPNAPS